MSEKGIIVRQLLSVFVDLVKTDIRSYTDRDWVKAYRIYFATSCKMIENSLIGSEVKTRLNIMVYNVKVLAHSEELQTPFGTIF